MYKLEPLVQPLFSERKLDAILLEILLNDKNSFGLSCLCYTFILSFMLYELYFIFIGFIQAWEFDFEMKVHTIFTSSIVAILLTNKLTLTMVAAENRQRMYFCE